jgi:hypothetical protein
MKNTVFLLLTILTRKGNTTKTIQKVSCKEILLLSILYLRKKITG